MKEKSKKIRVISVIVFIVLFTLFSYINIRGNYLEYKELGNEFLKEFQINTICKYSIMMISFIILYILIYFTNRGIKKGLKEFFEAEKVEMPKLPNKSLAFIISALVSSILSGKLTYNLLMYLVNPTFGKTDIVFNFDIGYYIFQKPFIEQILNVSFWIIVGLTAYMVLYYIIVFNKYFNGVEGKMFKKSLLVKKLLRNAMIIAILLGIGTITNTQNIVFGDMMSIKNSATTTYEGTSNNIELTGAKYTDVIIKKWGYFIFSGIVIIAIGLAIYYFKKGNTGKVLKSLSIIPIYLVIMFIIMIGFEFIFVRPNRLDKEKEFISKNIEATKEAYGLDVVEENLEYSGTITDDEIMENKKVLNNIPLVSKDMVLSTLQEKQKGKGYYNYQDVALANYNNQLVYVSPREILNSGRTYSNKTYEYTHGIGQIVTSATDVDDNGNIKYIQKDVSGSDDKLNTKEQRLYYGMMTDQTVATNTKNKKEYDYTDENGTEYTSTYNGKSGLELNFIDKIVLALSKGDMNLAFSNEITENSKILINRNIIKRAKKAMPYLMYDNKPYTVVTDEGKIVWVIDAYTTSNQYPYSQYMYIKNNNKKQKINYIRNSAKVIIDSYDGTISLYITDKQDPIVMAYNKLYPGIFKEEDIPKDIAKHLKYPQFLYEVQAELLKIYHNVKADILYRTDDIWDFAKYNNTKIMKSTGGILKPYYTMVKTGESDRLGLIQMYTPKEKSNIISYLVGTSENGKNKLKINKFSEDSNVVGLLQLEKQIDQDKNISSEIDELNAPGMKVSKDVIIVPLNNTILYVEPIYQTKLNESKIPVLKKLVVSSGNKIAIGDTLEIALANLLSKSAINFKIENTEDLKGVIEAIIKTNKNLNESAKKSDWEMAGKDFKKLQELIDSLEIKEQERIEREKELKKEKKINIKQEENLINEKNNNIDNNNMQ